MQKARAGGFVVQPGLFGTRRLTKTRLVIGAFLALASLAPLLYMLSLLPAQSRYPGLDRPRTN
jgi:hypothetical protein